MKSEQNKVHRRRVVDFWDMETYLLGFTLGSQELVSSPIKQTRSCWDPRKLSGLLQALVFFVSFFSD